jgi:membrane protease subunit (stomatin/prohibitin family)
MLEQLVGTDGRFEIEEVDEQLRALMVSKFAAWVGKANLSIYDFAAQYPQMGESLKEALHADFDQYGLGLETMLIENVTLPEEVEKAIDKRSQMGVIGDLGKYTQFQAANAIEASANNPGGGNAFLDAGVGVALGQQMAANLAAANRPQAAPVAPPPLPGADWFVGVGGQQQGPFDAAALANMARAGQLTRDSLVWKNGMAGWVAASGVAELSSVFGSVPPPLPPQ